LKVKTRDSLEVDVQVKTIFAQAGGGIEKIACRIEAQDRITDRSEQPIESTPNGRVIIDIIYPE